MQVHCLSSWLGSVVVIVSCVIEARAAAIYELVDLGGMHPTDINAIGQIVGGYPGLYWPQGESYGSLLSPSDYGADPIDLGFPPQTGPPAAINSYGQVAAPYQSFWTPVVSNGYVGAVTSIMELESPLEDPLTLDIGDDGTLVGFGWDFSNFGGYKSFVWKPSTPNGGSGSAFTLGGGNGSSVRLAAINSRGNIAGMDSDGAFVFIPKEPNGVDGVKHTLSLDQIGKPSEATGINDLGQVVGVTAVGDRWHAMFWVPDSANGGAGIMYDLGLMPGRLQSSAVDINNKGVLIGVADDNSRSSGTSSNFLNGLAFIWTSNGGMQDLTSLLDSSGDGWRLFSVSGINDRGQIVGIGLYDPDGDGGSPAVHRGFVLNPIPEPSGFGILVSALSCGLSIRLLLRCR